MLLELLALLFLRKFVFPSSCEIIPFIVYSGDLGRGRMLKVYVAEETTFLIGFYRLFLKGYFEYYVTEFIC
jgi:hypothetical protein